MAHYDLSLPELRAYAPEIAEPPDFDAFWRTTLAQASSVDIATSVRRAPSPLVLVDSFDVSFAGYGGQSVRAWYHRPASAAGALPIVVEFIGYSGGRGLVHQRQLYADAGYAHLVVDSRGQGWGGSVSATADPDPSSGSAAAPGVLTRGIHSPSSYYYRRLYIDAVRAVEAARTLDGVDADRVFVAGISQGGGLALAAASLSEGVAGVLADVPFLCHFARAATITDNLPYAEIAHFLKRNRELTDQAMNTLSYFDVANLVRRADAPALFSVALMDRTCPPSTVFAAYNRYAGEKDIVVYPFNEHEGGQEHQELARLSWLSDRVARGPIRSADTQ